MPVKTVCPLFVPAHLCVFVWVFVEEGCHPANIAASERDNSLTLTISLTPLRPAVWEIDGDWVGADILTGSALDTSPEGADMTGRWDGDEDDSREKRARSSRPKCV